MLSPSSIGVAAGALHFLYKVTLKRDWAVEEIPMPKRPFKLPVIFSREKLMRFLNSRFYRDPAHVQAIISSASCALPSPASASWEKRRIDSIPIAPLGDVRFSTTGFLAYRSRWRLCRLTNPAYPLQPGGFPSRARVRSGFTQRVSVIEGENLNVHGASLGKRT